MTTISPADLFFLTLSVLAAPVGAVWLIRERKSHRSRNVTPAEPRLHTTTLETSVTDDQFAGSGP